MEAIPGVTFWTDFPYSMLEEVVNFFQYSSKYAWNAFPGISCSLNTKTGECLP